MSNIPTLSQPTDRVAAFPRLSRGNVHTNGDTASLYHDDVLNTLAVAMADGSAMPIAPGAPFPPAGGGQDDAPRLRALMLALALVAPGTPIDFKPHAQYTWLTNCDAVSNTTLRLNHATINVAIPDTTRHKAVFTNNTYWDPAGITWVNLSAQADRGATTLTLSSVSGMAVGNYVQISAYVGTGVTEADYIVRKITAVNAGAGSIDIDMPLRYAIPVTGGQGAQVGVFTPLENFRVEGGNALVIGHVGDASPGGRILAQLVSAVNCTLRDIRFEVTGTVTQEYCASFDIGGRDNTFENIVGKCNSQATFGLGLEGQYNSRIINCRMDGALASGVNLNGSFACEVNGLFTSGGVSAALVNYGQDLNADGGSSGCQLKNIRAELCTGHAVRFEDGANNCTLEGLTTFGCNGALYLGQGLRSFAVHDIHAKGIIADSNTYAVYTNGATDCTVSQLTSRDTGAMIVLVGAGDTLAVAHGRYTATATNGSAVITVGASGQLDLTDVSGTHSGSATYASAVMMSFGGGTARLRARDCKFTRGTSGSGWGILNQGCGLIELDNCEISGNYTSNAVESTIGSVRLRGRYVGATPVAGGGVVPSQVTLSVTPGDNYFPFLDLHSNEHPSITRVSGSAATAYNWEIAYLQTGFLGTVDLTGLTYPLSGTFHVDISGTDYLVTLTAAADAAAVVSQTAAAVAARATTTVSLSSAKYLLIIDTPTTTGDYMRLTDGTLTIASLFGVASGALTIGPELKITGAGADVVRVAL